MRWGEVWTPPIDVLETSRIGRFLAWLQDARGLSFDGYADLSDADFMTALVLNVDGGWVAYRYLHGSLASRADPR